MITTVLPAVDIQFDQPIPTWFRIGGRAERFARPRSRDEVCACLDVDPSLRILGDGANLIVDDDGVPELVISLAAGELTQVDINDRTGIVRVGAGANLPKLITETVRRGLRGLEGLGGIPASVGGAIMMNAGGAFGQIADVVSRIGGVNRRGERVDLDRDRVPFSYRHSGLDDLVLLDAELKLTPDDPEVLRARLIEVMAYKKNSQPMAENSAGCCFKNPLLKSTIADLGSAGTRLSAGLLIDRAGCKGLGVGGATVSPRHANFIVTEIGARARHVLDLMSLIEHRVKDRFGIDLEREVVVWSRHT